MITIMPEHCATYWGTHGCKFARGHEGNCKCECCECVDHQANPEEGCVGSAPYYGPETRFYGEDAPNA